MAQAAKKPCQKFGCPALVRHSDKYCAKHASCDTKRNRERMKESHRAIYNTRRWRDRMSPYTLRRDPVCLLAKICVEQHGAPLPSKHADHIISVKERPDLAFDENNLQGLCELCHSWKTAQEDGAFGRAPLNRTTSTV